MLYALRRKIWAYQGQRWVPGDLGKEGSYQISRGAWLNPVDWVLFRMERVCL